MEMIGVAPVNSLELVRGFTEVGHVGEAVFVLEKKEKRRKKKEIEGKRRGKIEM